MVTYNENLLQGQLQGITRDLEKAQQALSAQFMKELIDYEVSSRDPPELTYQTNPNALSRLIRTQLGKTILFTDNDDGTNEEIVLAYRSQHHVEDAFRQMKHPHFLGWSPMFHWTDIKIRVHAFYCVLALTLTSLLQRALHQPEVEVPFQPARRAGGDGGRQAAGGGWRGCRIRRRRSPGRRRSRDAKCSVSRRQRSSG